MSAPHTLDVRLHEELAGAGLSAAERDRVVDLCDFVVAMVPGSGLPHPARTTRSAVHLLVGTDVPALDAQVRGAIARLCEVAAVRGLD
ncbi:hypothetical protein [Nocardioides daeguensis]|uniref:Uncharacterized protein n=1 Tax=Nocardioides daeguensis TaxID=908359 RepID=A0ABP6W5C1_9ACTN|nr:hypothetical protein [Nocardioides daeguensis]MBV6727794.1 hypothetical protein [Nocardioides daeguensis]MCR1775266.1 hypothetical protein [Nocardioides daeguensis]